MNIFTLAGGAVIICVLVVTVRQHRPDIAVVLSAAAGIVLFAYISAPLYDAVQSMRSILDSISDFQDEFMIILRALGVCLVAQLASEMCRDCGQASAAAKVELGAKATVLVMLIPIFTKIVETAAGIIDAS